MQHWGGHDASYTSEAYNAMDPHCFLIEKTLNVLYGALEKVETYWVRLVFAQCTEGLYKVALPLRLGWRNTEQVETFAIVPVSIACKLKMTRKQRLENYLEKSAQFFAWCWKIKFSLLVNYSELFRKEMIVLHIKCKWEPNHGSWQESSNLFFSILPYRTCRWFIISKEIMFFENCRFYSAFVRKTEVPNLAIRTTTRNVKRGRTCQVDFDMVQHN